jgi:hypothetical protein
MDREYPDWDMIGDWAKGPVNVLTMQGIFRDIPGDGFRPQEPATRAEIASILYRYLTAEYIENTQYADRDDFTFSDVTDREFWFGSGVGAWCTIVHISPDGSFDGYFRDTDMGVTGDGYPNGTMYECVFKGKFSLPVKTGDYEYTFKCESLTQEGVVKEERIEDGVLIITSEPYGFDDADEFVIYLPGKKLSELPEAFLEWVQIFINADSDDTLTFYGLYNVGGEQGFSG